MTGATVVPRKGTTPRLAEHSAVRLDRCEVSKDGAAACKCLKGTSSTVAFQKKPMLSTQQVCEAVVALGGRGVPRNAYGQR